MSGSRNDDRRAAQQAKLDALSERLEQAVERLVTGEDWLRAVTFAARFRSRSFTNTLLIYLQHAEAYEQRRVRTPEPTYVAGFRQWQQLGRSVLKAQSGYLIRSPVTAWFATTEPSDPGSWRRLRRRELPRPGEQVRAEMVGVKPAYVWDPLSRESAQEVTAGQMLPAAASASRPPGDNLEVGYVTEDGGLVR